MEELKIFTRAVERWDRDAGKEMPEYLKWFYNVFLDVYEEIYQETANMGGQKYRYDYAVRGMKDLVNAYQEEAEWYHQRYVPPFEEYLHVTMLSSTYQVLCLTSFVGMGDEATELPFKWAAEQPKILRASQFIARLMDDIAGHKQEKKRGHAISAVECYMKEHGDLTEEEAKKELHARVLNAWKDINEGCLRPNPIQMTLLTRILNLTKFLHVAYEDIDHYTHPETKFKEYIRCTIAEPLVM
ncbi:hypothetical protein MLD38_037282 [Melastoma candidum]|uniref:Uncharacterized protein n=1 Tax=Melastoma candidum TaxID=119954 RepID=A0ACB9LM98_9MYRT|nr:hypothetical protein MLD38_037282 [Melastoma candidum]